MHVCVCVYVWVDGWVCMHGCVSGCWVSECVGGWMGVHAWMCEWVLGE